MIVIILLFLSFIIFNYPNFIRGVILFSPAIWIFHNIFFVDGNKERGRRQKVESILRKLEEER